MTLVLVIRYVPVLEHCIGLLQLRLVDKGFSSSGKAGVEKVEKSYRSSNHFK